MSDRLLHTKVSKRKPLTHFPKKEDGHDGDMQIVSIKGKGTYLCIKDKSEWKISDKFNPRNKFDAHIFDEITTRKIKSSGGLIATFKSTTESVGTLSGKTFSLEENVVQPIMEIGDGINMGVLSSHESTPLYLKSGGSSTSSILLTQSGNIVNTINGTTAYNILFNNAGTGAGKVLVNNRATDGGNALLELTVNHTNSDAYMRYKFADTIEDTGDAANDIQWVHGFDGSDSDVFNFMYVGGDSVTALTPSTTTLNSTQFSIATSGNTWTRGTATAGGFTTTGTWTMDTSAGGTTGITSIDITNAFTDDDVTIMSAGAIKEKIESYGYTTTTGDITGVTLTGDSGGALADTAGSADFTIAGGTNCTSAGSGSTITLNVDDAFITNDADDTMVGTLTIDKDNSGTTTATVKGAHIDFDQTGAMGSGQTLSAYGLDIDLNTDAPTHVSGSTVIAYGAHISLTGNTSTTATFNTGIDIAITGGDTNTGIRMTNQDGDLDFKIRSSADVGDYSTWATTADGATTIATVDSDGTAGHLTLDPDGDLIASGCDVKIDAAKNLYLDGGGDTYLREHGTDNVRVVVGGDVLIQLWEKGDDGNEVSFGSSCVGFTQLEPTYNATTTSVDFRHSNKQFVTFGAGNITNMAMYFPLVSGNFVLLLKQDGTGSRTVTNWKSFEFDESAADGEAAVKWAGGSAPTLTTDANHVDILSFYWDADNEIAYGVATLDFQF